jgi:hypothetical protein
LSSILPSILTTPDGFPAKAATTRSDQMISSSVGMLVVKFLSDHELLEIESRHS